MATLRLAPKLDWTIRWNIKQIKEQMDLLQVYEENLEKIFNEEFMTEYCHINTDGENVTVTLHLLELTEDGISKLNEIADDYIIKPCGCDVVSLQIFQFKGAEE